MKIRTGFVSNSSSMSFYCEVCGDHYEVEARGGGPTTPEGWLEEYNMEQPTEGICDDCAGAEESDEGYMACLECLRPYQKKEMIISSDDYEFPCSDWVCYCTNRTCIPCFLDLGNAITPETKEEFINSSAYHNWIEKIGQPGYTPTDQDREIFKTVTGEDMPAMEDHMKIALLIEEDL